MGFTPLQDMLIRAGYIYLLLFSIYCVFYSIWISTKFKAQESEHNPYMKFIVISVMFLSILQCYQCIIMIEGKLNAGWWIPFFCKHGALWVYVLSLHMVSYKLDHADSTKIENQSQLPMDDTCTP